MFNLFKKAHEHSFFMLKNRNFPVTIDKAVEQIIARQEGLGQNVRELLIENIGIKADLAAIHSAYRDDLCGDCCHIDVCSKRASIKFGDYCEDKPLPCCLEVELEEIEDTEKKEAPITEGE